MFGFKKKRHEKIINEKVASINSEHQDTKLTSSLEDNIKLIDELFKDNDLIKKRRIKNSKINMQVCFLYAEGLTSSDIIDNYIVKPLMLADSLDNKERPLDSLLNEVIQINESKKTDSVMEIIKNLTYGDTILLIENESHAAILNSKSFTIRSISEPEAEQVISGPREGFTEPLVTNLSMVMRKLRTNELKMKFLNLGQRSNTQVCVCYIEGIADEEIINELYHRLSKIDMDGIIDSNYIEEQIRDARFSLFSTIGLTERPDVVAAKLLEGRVALLVDGCPVALTLPFLLIENFQSNEDYFISYYYSSFYRILRIAAFFVTITIPGFYVAIVAFHRETLPTTLLINIAIERQSVPFPAAIEVFVMLVVFEMVKETGIRIPSSIGQSLSIVGALVIGQSAVEAKLVAAPVIIVIAFSAITSLLVTKLSSAAVYTRFVLLILSSMLGLFGLILGLAAVVIHMYNLTSFNVRYVTPLDTLDFQAHKDILIRAPWWKMTTRPMDIAKDRIRVKQNADEEDD